MTPPRVFGEALRRLLGAISWVGVIRLCKARAWPSSVVPFQAKDEVGGLRVHVAEYGRKIKNGDSIWGLHQFSVISVVLRLASSTTSSWRRADVSWFTNVVWPLPFASTADCRFDMVSRQHEPGRGLGVWATENSLPLASPHTCISSAGGSCGPHEADT